MPLSALLSLIFVAISLIAAPAVAQHLTATLHVQGEVMVSTGGNFGDAVDGQPILPGQRIMVGDGATATVQFSQDCKRTYTRAGVYIITPALCDEDERERQSQEGAEHRVQSTSGSPLTTEGILLGTVIALPVVIDQLDDGPASR